jgi:hypothetical protein
LHGDHAYVFYQIPVKARQLPLVMWHGIGQFSKTWETTPDGREGYQNIFLRRDFGVYLIDQPRRGNAGRSTQPASLTPTPDEQGWFGTFRLGIWPDSYEPGSGFVFPEGEVPATIQSSGGPLAASGIPLAEFLLLTKIPIVIYYGDFIPKEPIANPGQDGWRARLEMARKWRDVVNKHGGDVTVVHLPEVGIKGNTHFPFSDLNNLQVADLMSTWLNKKGLDKFPKRK